MFKALFSFLCGSVLFSAMPAMAEDTIDEGTQLARAIAACEDTLIGRLDNREVYGGSSCEAYARQLEREVEPYLTMGRADQGTPAYEMSVGHLNERLNLCLVTDRSFESILDAMDRSGCDPSASYDPSYYRVPQESGSGSGYYSPGVVYTQSNGITHGSDGTTFVTSGNITHGSDGTTYVTSGNITHGSNGVTYVTSGAITHGSDGTVCTTSGAITHCH